MTIPAGIPLAAGFDPGTRIELRPDPSLSLRKSGPRVYWSDWALNPEPDEGGFQTDVAAMANRTPEGGRTAWFGHRVFQGNNPVVASRPSKAIWGARCDLRMCWLALTGRLAPELESAGITTGKASGSHRAGAES